MTRYAFTINSCNSLKFVAFVSVFFLSIRIVSAQNINIIPLPRSIVKAEGVFQLNGNTVIGMNDNSMLPLANYLQTELKRSIGISIAVDPDEAKAQIDFKLVKAQQITGAYDLKIERNKITITSSGNEGVFYGIISLLQLIRAQAK
jgi:hexosaminidase